MNEAQQTAERIARIETHLERIATVLEKTTQDHETRIRSLESDNQRTAGVLRLVGWLGAPATAGIILFLASKG